MNTDTELRFACGLGLAGILGIVLLAFGCVSPNVYPAAPGANTGYVDSYAETNDGLAWEVFTLSETGEKENLPLITIPTQ